MAGWQAMTTCEPQLLLMMQERQQQQQQQYRFTVCSQCFLTAFAARLGGSGSSSSSW
jgi:hypothetical protein